MIDLTKAPTSPRAAWELEIKMLRDHHNALMRNIQMNYDKAVAAGCRLQDEVKIAQSLVAEARQLTAGGRS